MKLTLLAVGRMKNGPEKTLFERYFERANAVGKPLGLHPVACHEIAESKAARANERMVQESGELLKFMDEKAIVIALDERGRSLASPAFAALIGKIRDDGARESVFLIGGADGLDPELRARADHIISFGALTWPHQIVRILISEQIYRAMSILAGHPYHKQ